MRDDRRPLSSSPPFPMIPVLSSHSLARLYPIHCRADAVRVPVRYRISPGTFLPICNRLRLSPPHQTPCHRQSIGQSSVNVGTVLYNHPGICFRTRRGLIFGLT
ncbi:unnamed protein product [Tuber melanosporum]|uniref:(Perigord truffle) hypothetical protein n=1 Tax=Tuber melanosporum (strain Mel28) TaxID=656061 RepID=D5GN59_TUBMM|nr:uncharacterized protein GSTUM_00011101001 [Tuber melanosporum]CAZ85952.1 unnamed protein product [Tuber melanosporum]